jgi:uracil-DNA glycosylase
MTRLLPDRVLQLHLAEHIVPAGVRIVDSYHCSRYNQNTGRLTAEMFDAVFARAAALRAG